MPLPTDYHARKTIPLYDFLTTYFPDALIELTRVSVEGNSQHKNPQDKIRWDRTKSMDQLNTAMRHLFDHGRGQELDTDGTLHLAKAAWRILAEVQLVLERQAKEQAELAVSDYWVPVAVGLGRSEFTELADLDLPRVQSVDDRPDWLRDAVARGNEGV